MKPTELTSAELNRAIIALDREQVKRGGFYRFVELAWQQIPYNANTPFVPAWHIEEMAIHAELCVPGSRLCPPLGYERDANGVEIKSKPIYQPPQIQELVANIPPGYTKSMIYSVLFLPWVWSFRPEYRAIFASFDDAMSKLNASHCRDLVTSRWYIERWGNVLDPVRSRSVGFYMTVAGGFRFSTSIGGKGTGRHCHAFITDDPVKPPAEDSGLAGDVSAALKNANNWLKTVSASRALDAKSYVRIMVMQRLAENDPSGTMIDQGKGNPTFCHLHLSAKNDGDMCVTRFGGDRRNANFVSPYARVTSVTDAIMLNPGRFPAEAEDKRARAMGGWDGVVAQSQLQQRPAPPGGLIFKKDTFQRFQAASVGVRGKGITLADTFSVLSVDCNFKKNAINSDVGFTIEGARAGQILTFAAFSETLGFVETEARIIALLKLWRVNAILIEDKANGPAIIDRLKQVHHFGNVIAPDPKTSKESRAHAANVFYQARSVFHNEGFAGIQDFENALAIFPRGIKKDVVDAHAQAVIYLAGSSGAEQMAAMQNMGDLSEMLATHYRLG